MRSDAKLRSRYDTNVGGSSCELVELFVVIEELDRVFGEFTLVLLLIEPAKRRRDPKLRLSFGDSARVKNLSAGTLAPSRKDVGLSATSMYPGYLGCLDKGAGATLPRWSTCEGSLPPLFTCITSRSVSDITERVEM